LARPQSMSPFSLLAEAPAEEILILTYVANLGFFERFALAESRRSGARVTVVYDARAEASDPRSVRFAGVSYLPGAAICHSGAAFHPKLVVAVSEDSARVLIGSGNMTPGGWHHNAELWTLLRADQAQAPGTLHDLATWLSGLPAEVRFSEGVEHALGRVAGLLAGFPRTESGPTLVSSLSQPIIDQLPSGVTADQLRVSAPFLDSDAEGLTQVHQRFGRPTLEVALQSAEAMFDGPGLVLALDNLGGRAFEIDDPALRYHHAKLVEWQQGEALSALTGSPNLTRRALLYGMPSGGNCELALIASIETSLMPPVANPIERDRLLAQHFDLPDQDATRIILLSALLNADGTTVVTTGRPIAEAATLERLADSQWQPLQEVEENSERLLVRGILAAGTPLRLRAASGQVSNTSYVVSLERATRRLQQGAPSRSPPDPNDLFDIAIVEAILAEVIELKSHIAAPSSGGASGTDTPAAGPPKPQSWRELLEDRAQRHGDPLMAFALGLPGLAAATSHRAEVFDEDTANDLDASEHEQAMVEVDAVEQTNRRISNNAAIKQRYLRALKRIAALTPDLPVIDRLLALRILLRAIALTALWDAGEDWSPLVAESALAVADADDVYPEMQAAQASLAATALTLLRSGVRLSSASSARSSYERVSAAVRPLAGNVDADLVAIYVSTLWPRGVTGAPPITPESVEILVEQLQQHDPIDQAIATLESELGVSARRHGALIEIEDELAGDIRRRLIHAASLARGAPVVAAYGSDGATSALVVWQLPVLIVLRRGAQPYGGRYHSHTPEELVSSSGEIPGRKEELRQPERYSQTAIQALRAAGLDPFNPFRGLR
jgi:hypothetical protein